MLRKKFLRKIVGNRGFFIVSVTTVVEHRWIGFTYRKNI